MSDQLKLKRCRCGAPIDCSGAIMVEGCGVPFEVCGKCGMLREPDYEGTIRDLHTRLAAAEERAEKAEVATKQVQSYLRGTLGFIDGVDLLTMARDVARAYHANAYQLQEERKRLAPAERDWSVARDAHDRVLQELLEARRERDEARAEVERVRERGPHSNGRSDD